MATKDLFANLDKYRQFFPIPDRPAAFPKEKVATELQGLSSLLGKTDYSERLKESEDLAKLQLYLSLAQRGFGAMGEQPRRGESPVGVLGRTLAAPLAGDLSTIAGRLMQQRQATKLAEQQEERQLALSALTNVRRRQEQDYAARIKQDDQARNLALKMAQKSVKISNDYEVKKNGKWVSAPVFVEYDWDGGFKNFLNQNNKVIKNDPGNIRVWRKASNVKPFVKGIPNVYLKKSVDGEIVRTPDPGAVRVTDPTGANSRVLSGNTRLDFGPNGNAEIIKPGSKTSLYESSVQSKAYATPGLVKLLGLDAKMAGKQLTRNTYNPKPGTNQKPYSTFTIGAATYDLRTITDTVDGEQKPTYNSTDQTVQKDGAVYNLPALTTDQDPLDPALSGQKEVFVQVRGPGEALLAPKKVTRAKEKRYDPVTGTYKLVDTFFDSDGSIVQNAVEVDDRNDPFKTVQPLRVTADNITELRKNPWAKNIRIDEEILVQESKGKENTGAPSQFRYIYKGMPVEIKTGKEALATGDAPDLVTYQNITTKDQKYKNQFGETVVIKPGASLRISAADFAAADRKIQDAFSDDSVIQARARKGHDFTEAWAQLLEQNPPLRTATNQKPTSGQLNSLHAMFPGTRVLGDRLNKAIFNMIRLSSPPLSGVSAPPTQTDAEQDETYDYAVATERKLEEAGKRYEALRARELVSDPWQSLSFLEKQAFSKIPPRGIRAGEVNKQIIGAVTNLEKRRDRFKTPSSDDTTAFSSTIETLIRLKALKKGGELNQTGVFEGVFSKLGARVFADFGIFSSSPSKRLNQIITGIRANLKTLSASEGADGRPSNFRLELQQEVLPSFTKPQELNERNLDTLINKLENSVRSYFGTSLANDTVIPQTFVRMAREAGIPNVRSQQRNYPWINPRASLEEPLPVTKQRTLESLGLIKFSNIGVRALLKGAMLPPDDDGRQFQKISDTEVQQVVNGTRTGRKYKIDDFFKRRGRF